jgi:hypothetical protein
MKFILKNKLMWITSSNMAHRKTLGCIACFLDVQLNRTGPFAANKYWPKNTSCRKILYLHWVIVLPSIGQTKTVRLLLSHLESEYSYRHPFRTSSYCVSFLLDLPDPSCRLGNAVFLARRVAYDPIALRLLFHTLGIRYLEASFSFCLGFVSVGQNQ